MVDRSQQREQAIASLKRMVERSGEAIRFPFQHQFQELMQILGERVQRASDEGIALLESEGSMWAGFRVVPDGRGAVAFLTHTLEEEAERSEGIVVRRLLAAHGVLQGDFDTVCRNLEPVAALDLDELPWLVAAALWVQWGSGQVIAHQLKEVLLRLRAANPRFDAHVMNLKAQPREGIRDAAVLVEALMASPSAILPEPDISPRTES